MRRYMQTRWYTYWDALGYLRMDTAGPLFFLCHASGGHDGFSLRALGGVDQVWHALCYSSIGNMQGLVRSRWTLGQKLMTQKRQNKQQNKNKKGKLEKQNNAKGSLPCCSLETPKCPLFKMASVFENGAQNVKKKLKQICSSKFISISWEGLGLGAPSYLHPFHLRKFTWWGFGETMKITRSQIL